MSRKAIFCLASSQHHAQKLVHRLKNRGFQGGDVSALYMDGTAEPDAGSEEEAVSPAAGVPGPVDGELAWLRGIGPICIPGYIGAGPIVRALKMAQGAASTRIGRGLAGLGVPETEAKSFQQKIKRGRVLISYHSEHAEEITRAQTQLQLAGAQDFCGTDESMATEDVSIFGEGARMSVPSVS